MDKQNIKTEAENSSAVDTIVTPQMEWIDNEKNPIAEVNREKHDGGETVTWWSENIDKPFLAAVPTNSGWWIEKCIIIGEQGLKLLCEDYEEYAGYELDDIAFYAWITPPVDITEFAG